MFTRTDEVTNFVAIEMESGDKIVVELYPETAPITVENFKNLVSEKFYNGIIFHRVIAGFMIQGGDPTGTGCGGSEECIPGEFIANGFNNTLAHKRGVVSMARTNDPNSASSQFFIMHADGDFLNGQYAAFGRVTEGMYAVDRIAKSKTDMRDKPILDCKILKAEIIYR